MEWTSLAILKGQSKFDDRSIKPFWQVRMSSVDLNGKANSYASEIIAFEIQSRIHVTVLFIVNVEST